MTKEDFLAKYDLPEEEFSHVPDHAEIKTEEDFERLENILINETTCTINSFDYYGGPTFSRLEVDYEAISMYVEGLMDSEFASDHYEGIDYWWKA